MTPTAEVHIATQLRIDELKAKGCTTLATMMQNALDRAIQDAKLTTQDQHEEKERM